jgi:hypothetical protein
LEFRVTIPPDFQGLRGFDEVFVLKDAGIEGLGDTEFAIRLFAYVLADTQEPTADLVLVIWWLDPAHFFQYG